MGMSREINDFGITKKNGNVKEINDFGITQQKIARTFFRRSRFNFYDYLFALCFLRYSAPRTNTAEHTAVTSIKAT